MLFIPDQELIYRRDDCPINIQWQCDMAAISTSLRMDIADCMQPWLARVHSRKAFVYIHIGSSYLISR